MFTGAPTHGGLHIAGESTTGASQRAFRSAVWAADRGGTGASDTTAITNWVQAHYKRVKIGGQTVYDLGASAS